MTVILVILGIIFSGAGLYGGAVIGMGLGEAISVAIGIFFILWATFRSAFKTNGFLKFLRRLFVFALTVLVIYSAGAVAFGNMNTVTYTEDYVIVLGAGLKGYEPSPALAMRLDKAIEYLNRNRTATAIVTGGQGKDESLTEAQAMEYYLLNRGVDASRIIREDTSASTYENFKNVRETVAGGTAAVITNDFHILRASQMAALNGITATHLGAPTPPTLYPTSCMRELVAQIAAIRYYI